jgi:hypothetical protein
MKTAIKFKSDAKAKIKSWLKENVHSRYKQSADWDAWINEVFEKNI